MKQSKAKQEIEQENVLCIFIELCLCCSIIMFVR